VANTCEYHIPPKILVDALTVTIVLRHFSPITSLQIPIMSRWGHVIGSSWDIPSAYDEHFAMENRLPMEIDGLPFLIAWWVFPWLC